MICLDPQRIVVLPVGSSIKKDGTKGRKVLFGNQINGVHDYSSNSIDLDTGETAEFFQIPCGKCLNCKKNKTQEWLHRLEMEASCYKDKQQLCFATFTYEDKSLPHSPSGVPTLRYDDFQLMLKSLRKKVGNGLRFLVSGEYGGQFQRPHYHAIFFGYDFFKGAKFFKMSQSGIPLYTNNILTDAWKRGHVDFGRVTPSCMNYTAQYVVKRLTEPDAMRGSDRVPELIQMSRRPGIGFKYIEEHYQTIVRDGGVYLEGEFVPASRYVVKSIENIDGITNFQMQMFKKRQQRIAEMLSETWKTEHPQLDRFNLERVLADKYIEDKKHELRLKYKSP